MSQDRVINIVGAGVSGLIAAIVLEKHGFKPVIFELSDREGGRVKTDFYKGYQLDHGFQVLLTSYEAANKYLNYDDLNLQNILPGTVVFEKGKKKIIGDPLRDVNFLLPTIFSGIGSFTDKLNIFKLNKVLKRKTIAQIFKEKEKTTYNYLKDFGFSERIIDVFFKPFFSGIFLETDLHTSSRMFEFIYKMFGEGFAAIPKGGMQEIPKQLKSKLKNTEFKFNTKVKEVNTRGVLLEGGDFVSGDVTIVTSNLNKLIKGVELNDVKWKSCQTLYFTLNERGVKKSLIGLVADEESLINNIFYHTSIQTNMLVNKELLSVTVVKSHNLNEKELIKKVENELKELCGIDRITFLKIYNIPMSLPEVENLRYSDSDRLEVKKNIILAGDVLLNGSLNGAIMSGENAALKVIQKFS